MYKNGNLATGFLQDIVHKDFPNLGSSIEVILIREKDGDAYSVVTSVSEDAGGNIVVSKDTLAGYFKNKPSYVDAITRLTGLNDFDRSGDIVLIMKDRIEDDPTDRYTTGVACKSWHGSMNPSDSYVPFILSYPSGNNAELNNITQEVCVTADCAGNWVLPEIIKNSVGRQFPEN